MKKYIVGAVLSFGLLASPAFTQAAGLTSSQVQAILMLLSSFGADQATINSVETALNGGTPTTSGTAYCHNFNSDLTVGNTGEDVAALNRVLQSSGIDTTGNSSTFDENNAADVVAFQSHYGIRQTGYVGPLTRAKLNALYGCHNGQQPTQPTPSTATPVSTQPSPTVTPNTTTVTTTPSSLICSLVATPDSVVAGQTVDLVHRSDTATYALWQQDGAANVLGLSGDKLSGNGGEYINTTGLKGVVTPTILMYGGSGFLGSCHTSITINVATATTQPTSTSVTPAINVTFPNGGEQLTAGLGKDVDFRISWTSHNLSGTAYVYLNAVSGADCLLGTAPVSQGNFALLYGHYNCQNTAAVLSSGQYKVLIETDTALSSGKYVNTEGNGYFTLSLIQPAPSISYISPTISSGKSVDLIDVYGSNLVQTSGSKGGTLYVDLMQNGVSKLRLNSTDSPMTIYAGVYLTPQDTTGSHIQVRVATESLSSGTYQLVVTTDAGSSGAANFIVQ